jgi:hypothetical protein
MTEIRSNNDDGRKPLIGQARRSNHNEKHLETSNIQKHSNRKLKPNSANIKTKTNSITNTKPAMLPQR